MNQIFLEERSKEKVKDAMSEGLRSQEYYRSGARKIIRRNLPTIILVGLGILMILGILFR
jgi:hypothetical protein